MKTTFDRGWRSSVVILEAENVMDEDFLYKLLLDSKPTLLNQIHIFTKTMLERDSPSLSAAIKQSIWQDRQKHGYSGACTRRNDERFKGVPVMEYFPHGLRQRSQPDDKCLLKPSYLLGVRIAFN